MKSPLSWIRSLLGIGEKRVNASLDAAATTDENVRHWRDADRLSARAAFSPTIRDTVRIRSRHEAENNPWYAGILRTVANHIVGTGPRLQVLTPDPIANARIERAWRQWAKIVGLTEKLRIGVETYWRDGEVFYLRRFRPTYTSQVPLEICYFEADQVTNPYFNPVDPQVEDGIRLDQFNRAIAFWILDHHPGDINVPWGGQLSGDWYPGTDVCHLFRSERPGQVRGIPRITPSLELFPKLRRHTSATLLAAEAIANWTLFVKTTASSITPVAMPKDFATVDFERNMLNFLPDGWEPFQIKPEQPTTNHAMFQMQTLMEICRGLNVPYLLAAGTSKDSNFASAKMDLRNIWEPEVVSEQDRIEQMCLDRFFCWFMEEAAMVPGLLDGMPEIVDIDHQWHWDPLPTTDEIDAANAAKIRTQSGLSTHPQEYARNGLDFESTIARGAQALGVTVDEYRRAIFTATFPAASAPVGSDAAPVQAEGNVPLASLGRRQFTNNVKATRDVLTQFIAGDISETQAQLLLQGLGWSERNAEAFINDAMDGVIDDPALQGVSV